MRFSVFPGSKTCTPMLGFCNTGSKVFFFDLSRLQYYWDNIKSLPENPYGTFPLSSRPADATTSFSSNTSGSGSQIETKGRGFLVPIQRRNRGGGAGGAISRIAREVSPTESDGSHQTGSDGQHDDAPRRASGMGAAGGGGGVEGPKVNWTKSHENWTKKYYMGDALEPLEAHHTEVVKLLGFTGRQVAWSGDGEWCVVVGSAGVVALLQRGRRS
jgi:polycomb protein EED